MTGPSRVLSPLALFLAFSDGWTFAFRSIAAAMPGSVWDAPGRAWFLVGGAGLVRRTVDPRRCTSRPGDVALGCPRFAPGAGR